MSLFTPAEQTVRSISADSKKAQILASALLGFIILMAVGFSPIEVVHNATHDTRHSTGFPCH